MCPTYTPLHPPLRIPSTSIVPHAQNYLFLREQEDSFVDNLLQDMLKNNYRENFCCM